VELEGGDTLLLLHLLPLLMLPFPMQKKEVGLVIELAPGLLSNRSLWVDSRCCHRHLLRLASQVWEDAVKHPEEDALQPKRDVVVVGGGGAGAAMIEARHWSMMDDRNHPDSWHSAAAAAAAVHDDASQGE